jgi:hypothetical protein
MKYDCQDIRTLLEEHIDKQVDQDTPAPATGLLAEHLNECADCRREVEQERELRETFTSLPQLSCPPQVAEFLETVPEHVPEHPETVPHIHTRSEPSRARQEASPRWWSRLGVPSWQPVAFAAAAAIVLLLVTSTPDQHDLTSPGAQYTQAEIETARQQAESTLLYTLGVIHKSEKEVIGGILGEQLPQAIKGSLRKTWERTQGGQG